MIGSTMEEIKEKILDGHEIEFTYNKKEYSIEPDQEGDNTIIKIWEHFADEGVCIASIALKDDSEVENVFNYKCFSGKSFYEIEKEVTVDTIF